MCSRPRTHGEWASGAVLWCGSRAWFWCVDEEKACPRFVRRVGWRRWVLVTSLLECASSKVRVLLPASTAPARDARLFSRQRWICPRERDVDVLHRSSTQYTRGARWRQASRSKGVSCQNNRSREDMLRGIGNMTTTTARCLEACFPGCLSYSRCPREIMHRERVTLGGIKMSNQICRQRPRAVAVNYMARLSSAPARPCTVRKTAEIKSTHRPRISLIPIDMCTWHRLPCRWLPPTHRTHAAAPSRDDRCRVVWRASTHRL
jgi:hypothetical protein